MKVFTLERELVVPQPIEDVFPFFADAHNLEVLTPEFLNFSILTPAPIDMFEGQLIDYRIKLHGIPIRWRTRIAAWEPPYRFVDEQIKGPYRLWRHEHTFEAHPDGGSLLRDRVEYAMWGGALIHSLFVKKDLERIFDHRHQVMRERFCAPQPTA